MVIRRQSGSEWQEGLRMRPVIIYDAGETADIRGNIILFVSKKCGVGDTVLVSGPPLLLLLVVATVSMSPVSPHTEAREQAAIG